MTLSRGRKWFRKKIIGRKVLAKALNIMLGSLAQVVFHLRLCPLSHENAGGGYHFGVEEENYVYYTTIGLIQIH